MVGNGECIFSLGTTDLVLEFGQHSFSQKAYVVETTAFSALLGTDFTEGNEHFCGFLTRPPRILIDNEEFVCQDMGQTFACNRIFRMFRTESYSLTPELRNQVFNELDIPKTQILVDCFANHGNHQERLYMTRENSAFR